MLITALGGLEGHLPPAYPTFDDVQPGAWYSNYVEAAATLGIVTGYSDAQGNLIGLFGPADSVNRAAATKMLVEAFDLGQIDGSLSHFPDVQEEDWFYDYVMIAQHNEVVSGYVNGSFGPDDAVTRAQMAKMLVRSLQAAGLIEFEEKPEVETVDEEETETGAPSSPDDETDNREVSEESAQPAAEPNLLSIEETSVPAGSTAVFVAKYNFRALYEGFRVETVTVVNDVTDDQLGDQIEGSPAIKNVMLKFPDESGLLVTESRPLSADGRVRFTNLDFFVPRDEDTFFEVYAELNKLSDVGESLSGEVFRLGLQDSHHDDSSFRAVGSISDTVYGYGNNRLSVSSQQLAPFTVRKALPLFSLNEGEGVLTSGQNTLLSFDVTAEGGSIGLARLVFDVSVSDAEGSDLNLSNFRLYRGSHYLDQVTIHDAGSGQDLSEAGAGTLENGLSSVIVAFDQEETVANGESESYSLRADAGNARNDDSIASRLAMGDELSPLSGLIAVNQPNTGKLYVNGDASAGIFTSATDFSQSLGQNCHVIWSDQSADTHLYPTVSGGTVTDGSGSHDWTNGYRLGLSSLEDYVITK